MKDNITVYSYRRCPFAIRVRMTLHEKHIPFNVIEEDLKCLSQTVQKYHPESRVPVLMHNDLAIYESAIITEYIDDLFDQNPLMPKNAQEKMSVRQWTYWCNHIFKPEIDKFKYGGNKMTDSQRSDSIECLTEYVLKIDDQLKQSPWLVGDCFTLADIHVFPFYRQLSNTTPPHPRMSRFSAANAWLEKITARESFVKTMEKNPDQ